MTTITLVLENCDLNDVSSDTQIDRVLAAFVSAASLARDQGCNVTLAEDIGEAEVAPCPVPN